MAAAGAGAGVGWDDSGSYVVPNSSSAGEFAEGGIGNMDHNNNPSVTPTGSAGGSLQNESGSSILLGGDGPGSGSGSGSGSVPDLEYGFGRPEMNSSPLVGTVHFYERHLFLCYKNPESWPPKVEAADFDRLPRLLAAAIKQRKDEMPSKTTLTICEGRDGTETSNGDVLMFPDMMRYKGLTHFDVDSFVDEVLVKNAEWPSGNPEPLTGWHIFICAHGSRDRRCGVCGPALVKAFREEIETRGLKGAVSVSPCSHVGGHKYAGNVIIYGPNADGEVSGHWYGYVTPDDVIILLEQHIGKGEVVDRLWRGQMGLTGEEQKKAQEERINVNEETNVENAETERELKEVQNVDSGNEPENIISESVQDEGTGCCMGTNAANCCQNESPDENGYLESDAAVSKNEDARDFSYSPSKGCLGRVSAWFETWEREDTLATLAVVGAIASIGIAYHIYRRSSSN